jgi:hypothetical protein
MKYTEMAWEIHNSSSRAPSSILVSANHSVPIISGTFAPRVNRATKEPHHLPADITTLSTTSPLPPPDHCAADNGFRVPIWSHEASVAGARCLEPHAVHDHEPILNFPTCFRAIISPQDRKGCRLPRLAAQTDSPSSTPEGRGHHK